MSGTIDIAINQRSVKAALGMTVLDAAEKAGLRVPCDCRNGRCGACEIEVMAGQVDAPGHEHGAPVLACTARLTGAAAFRFDPQPKESRTTGEIVSLQRLSGEIYEVTLRVSAPIPYLPGQYVKLGFGTLPWRDFCPTLSLDGLRELDTMVFHIRACAGGAIAGMLGKGISEGKRVKLRGPFGAGFLRPGNGRLVLVSSGTGFAPIWSMAVAARLGQPHRPLSMVISARDPRDLYMRPALEWLVKQGVDDLVLTTSGAHPLPPARHGRATAALPRLSASDTIYAAGHPGMIDAIRELAVACGATIHAQPFHAAEAAAAPSGRLAALFGS